MIFGPIEVNSLKVHRQTVEQGSSGSNLRAGAVDDVATDQNRKATMGRRRFNETMLRSWYRA